MPLPSGSDLKKGPHKLKGQKAVPYTPPTDIGKAGIVIFQHYKGHV